MRALTQQRGLTLIEVIVTVAIFGLVAVATVYFLRSAYEAQRFTIEEARAINEARRGLKVMLAELREARDGEDGSYILEQADDQEIIFYSDMDKDGGVEKVRYFLDGTNLVRGVTEPQDVSPVYPVGQQDEVIISQFVRNGALPIFTYYNGGWPGDLVNNPLPTPTRLTETKLIKVKLLINENLAAAPVDFELNGAVQIRNLKTNL